jgi:hypothetical protein
MTRLKYALALVLLVGTFAWMVTRSGKTAGAAEVPVEVHTSEFGDNTEDVAQHRWVHNAPRHWRSLVVKR